ncbi:MAG: hypothetical protein QOE25_1145, partial [Actinomycetota bacterium]|nr:hypothetical protein [Actinomycetota bacterium]
MSFLGTARSKVAVWTVAVLLTAGFAIGAVLAFWPRCQDFPGIPRLVPPDHTCTNHAALGAALVLVGMVFVVIELRLLTAADGPKTGPALVVTCVVVLAVVAAGATSLSGGPSHVS